MKRREILGGSLSAAVSAAMPGNLALADGTTRVRPGGPRWPTSSGWAQLKEAVAAAKAGPNVPRLSQFD